MQAKVKARCINCGKDFDTFVLFVFQKYYLECFCCEKCLGEFTARQHENWQHMTNPEISEEE
jgi:hypothetical protein